MHWSTRAASVSVSQWLPCRRTVAGVCLAGFMLLLGCAGETTTSTQFTDGASADVPVAPVPATTTPTAAVPVPTAIPAPTATPEPAPSPTPTPTPTPTTLPTATPEPDPVVIRTAGGAMLPVRGGSAANGWRVGTPCFEEAVVSSGLSLSGSVDILLDPGHGGDEIGAATGGLRESDVNLRVAERVRRRLVDRGYRVLQTRYSDHRSAIQSRAEIANALQPTLFISIHHNGGFPEPIDVIGTEIFVQVGSEDSRRLGGVLFEELTAAFADVEAEWTGTSARGVSWRINAEGTDLYGVLRRTTGIVSVLTEAMYLSSPAEAALLEDPAILDIEADAIVAGIERWYADPADDGSGHIDGLEFLGRLDNGGGTEGCVDPPLE